MLKQLGILFAGLFTATHWKRRWETILEMVRDPRNFFSGIGKAEVDEKAYQLGLTTGFVGTVLLSMMTAGMVALLSGFKGFLTGPLTFVAILVFWLVGVFLLYYVVAWIHSLAVKWVIGPYEPAKIRPVLFAVGVSALAFAVPGIGGLIGLAVIIVLTVIAYEAIFRATRGQAIGATLLGMFLTALPAFVLSFTLAGAMILFQGAGLYGLTDMMSHLKIPGKSIVHQQSAKRADGQEASSEKEPNASETMQAIAELGQKMQELAVSLTATPVVFPTPETSTADEEENETLVEPATPTAIPVEAAQTIGVTRVPTRIVKPRPTPTEEVLQEKPRTIQIYRVPARKKE